MWSFCQKTEMHCECISYSIIVVTMKIAGIICLSFAFLPNILTFNALSQQTGLKLYLQLPICLMVMLKAWISLQSFMIYKDYK